MVRNWEELYLNDEFNERGTRTRENVETWKFNCGGYALGTYNWFCPYENDEESERLFEYPEKHDLSVDETAEETTQWMLDNIPGLRRVNDIEDLHDDEYLIAYKTGWQDFHFMKRSKNGNWWHKMGSGKTVRISKQKVMADTWFNEYNSKTIFLAKKDK